MAHKKIEHKEVDPHAHAKHAPKKMDADLLAELQNEQQIAWEKDRAVTRRSTQKANLANTRFLDIEKSYSESRGFVLKNKDPELAEAHLQSVLQGTFRKEI
jgi:hypothetical protein